MASWKAAGPDKEQAFCIKKMSKLHVRPAKYNDEFLRNPDVIPNWLVKCRTETYYDDQGQIVTDMSMIIKSI